MSDWEQNERLYNACIRCGEYYTASGLLMDMLSSLLTIRSAVDPETGVRLYGEDPSLVSTLTWLCRDPDGERVERWLNMLAENPQSIQVLAEVAEHTREDFRRLVEQDERAA